MALAPVFGCLFPSSLCKYSRRCEEGATTGKPPHLVAPKKLFWMPSSHPQATRFRTTPMRPDLMTVLSSLVSDYIAWTFDKTRHTVISRSCTCVASGRHAADGTTKKTRNPVNARETRRHVLRPPSSISILRRREAGPGGYCNPVYQR